MSGNGWKTFEQREKTHQILHTFSGNNKLFFSVVTKNNGTNKFFLSSLVITVLTFNRFKA